MRPLRNLPMQIKGFVESSLLEWEGKIASVIFLPRCNMRCRYCHAGPLIVDPDALEDIPRDQMFRSLRQHEGWLDGVAITGGEPTLHCEELAELIRDIRALGLAVMIETNGTRPDCIGRLIRDGLLDAISMDVKAPLTPAGYRRVTPSTDVDLADIRASLRLIRDSGIEHEFRITLVPGIVGADELVQIGPEVAGAQQIALQNFKAALCLDEALQSVQPYSSGEMDEFGRLVAPFAGRIVLRGRENRVTAAGGHM